jgi:hypothetical protein
MKRKHYRQGDVLVIEGVKQTTGENIAKKDCPEGVILAEGEATGHHHALRAPVVGFFTPNDKLPLNVVLKETVSLTHQEHDAIDIPGDSSGVNYDIIRQVQYTPTELQRVAD